MVARADNGGLGTICWEVARHLHPDRILILDLAAQGRGEIFPDRFLGLFQGGEVATAPLPPTDDQLAWLVDGLDLVYTAEVPYAARLFDHADRAGCRVAIHAMPELWRPQYGRADLCFAPTTWMLDELPDPIVLPIPIARDRLPDRGSSGDGVRVLYHAAAPAFKDRNGTDLFLAALSRMTEECSAIVRGRHRAETRKFGRVTVEFRDDKPENYWDAYPEEADALVLPRRFGGLSLLMQEAASLGLPVISTDLPPQNDWLPPDALAPATNARLVRMAGGSFRVWSCAPEMLAAVLDGLVAEPDLAEALANESLAFADSL